MRLGIIGSRKFTDWVRFQYEMLQIFGPVLDFTLIISGGAKGADTLAELYADRNGIKTKIIKPDW